MTANVVNQVAYLRTSRNFPEDITLLTVEINKSYVDIANAVNARTIGIFPTNRPAITGESWFLTNQRQQTLRQVYPFSVIAPGATLTIPHGIMSFVRFTKIYGTCFTTQPDDRPLPYVSTVAGFNISLRVDRATASIVIVNGASNPQINDGQVILEWLSSI